MKTVTFDITGKCNLRCVHCSTEEPILGVNRCGNGPELQDCRNAFLSFKRLGIEYVHFLGGEPTVRPDLPQIIEQAVTIGLKIGMNTNGILLTEETLESLVKAGLKRIVLSIDGPNEKANDYVRGKGTYLRICRAADTISSFRKKYGATIISFAVQATLTKLWINNLPDMFELCKQFYVDELILKKVGCSGRARKYIDILDFDDDTFFSVAKDICLCKTKAHIDVNSPFPPLVIAYFNQMLGLKNSRLPLMCEGGEKKFHCFLTGSLVPCVPYAERYGIRGAPNVFTDNPLDTLMHNSYFNCFKVDVQGIKNMSNKFEPCENCLFFRNLCTPCPLIGYNRDRVDISLCTIVEQKIVCMQ